MQLGEKVGELLRGDEPDGRVRVRLAESLYTRPLTLLFGSTVGACAALVAAVVSRVPAIEICAALLAVVSLIRIVVVFFLYRVEDGKTKKWLHIAYESGAFAYALLVGLLGTFAFVYPVDQEVRTLTCVYAMAYGTAVAARNAGRPTIAIGQLVLAIAPVVVAAIASGSLVMVTLGITMALFTPALVGICRSVSITLRESFAAAETSARLADRMREIARTDEVTGLCNRAALNHDMVEKLMTLPKGHKMAFFWLDLDHFKELNDTLGHPIGDKVLKAVAQRLRSLAPEGATISRFGGDEFILACELEDRTESEILADRIHSTICRPLRIDTERLTISSSMGVALLPDDGQDLDTLMQSADLALYHAKVNGRGQARFFDASMTRNLVRRKEIETELRQALRRDELSIFFQPIVDLETGRIRTFEALVRWFHPEKGELRPDEFIPVAEETGAIITLGNWITVQAARAAAQWPDDVNIAVNLSPMQIKAPGAALGILNALREAKLEPSRLELEVTESLFVDDNENTARFIEELSSVGVRFALDDFGTGYSSLGYINKYPFSKIKVDRSFVSGPNIGKKSDAIIRAVAEMGATLDMEIVAEGLEKMEQVQAVREAGCTLGQGYYFSRAVPDYLAAMLLAQERDEGFGRQVAI